MALKHRDWRFALAAASLAAAASPIAASAQPRSGPLLATDLFFEERGPARRGLWTADPLLARYPAILRALRTEGVRAAQVAEECTSGLPCNRTIRDEYMFGGTRLLSVLSTTSQFTGGAHGSYGVADRIYDLRTGRRIRFGDLFTSWSRVKPILQARVCTALREMRPENGIAECPDVGELAFGLTEAAEIPVGGPASGFEVRTSDYQLGSYADGTETAYVTLDRQLLGMIKPEYRADFRAPEE